MLAPNPPPSADNLEQTSEEAAKKPLQTCGICDVQISKYKCPTCLLSYCSLACFTQHKPTHANDTASSKPVVATLPPTLSDSTDTIQLHKAYTATKTHQEALLSSTELKSLLQENPKLRARLRGIYQATIQPPPPPPADEQQQTYHNRRTRHEGPWTEEKGTKRGVEALRKARAQGGEEEEEEGLETFLRLLEKIHADHIG